MSSYSRIVPAFAAIGAVLAVAPARAEQTREERPATWQNIQADVVNPAAQATPTATESSDAITVTASRISAPDSTAPTPTAVIGADTIAQRGQSTISDVLLDLPEMRASRQPSTVGLNVRGPTSSPDLRGLGDVRTLLLVDGARMTPAQLTGVFRSQPHSCADGRPRGSGDRRRFSKLGLGCRSRRRQPNPQKTNERSSRGESYNTTDENDDREWRAGLVGGSDFAGNRGHFVVGFDYVKNDGIGDNYARDWGKQEYLLYNNACAGPAGTPVAASLKCVGNVANGFPQKLIAPHVVNFGGTPSGLILAVQGGASASLVNQQFNANGTTFPILWGRQR